MNDLTGKKFGRLRVIRKADIRQNYKELWECVCECGTKTLVTTYDLNSGHTKSCGCLRKENTKASIKDGTRICLLTAKLPKNNTSGYKGVYWQKSAKKWQAEIEIRAKRIYLGIFENKEDAIKARKEAEEKYFKPVIEEFKKVKECIY